MLGEHDAVRPAGDEVSDVDNAPAPAPRSGAFAIAAILAFVVVWFAVVWRVFGKPLIDAIGEAAGGALAVLVLVSVIGAVRRSRSR